MARRAVFDVKDGENRVVSDAGFDLPAYKKAGVDIDGAAASVRKIKELARATQDSHVISGIGGFSGLYHAGALGFRDLVLSAGADGVGTKVKIAQAVGKHDTVGIDLVAMNVDDVVTSGATPLFFLDYIAIGRLNPKTVEDIVKGIVEGCRMARCVLLGGETAQMPDVYEENEYDLAGFCVGAVEKTRIIDGRNIKPGDVLIGLESSGLHSNGYTLARKVLLEKAGLKLDQHIGELGRSLAEELLEPTRIYAPLILELIESVPLKGVAHITGGGIYDNVSRILPPGTRIEITKNWNVPRIFDLIQKLGDISWDEMYRVFNMGVGMVLVVSPDDAGAALRKACDSGVGAFEVGVVREEKR
ncbi:MAG TPA: phosphoribosylformylglycinamidine cyclo-ligase [Firmicutes bacterium]|nr:phosphoribosylformylglycinamidine cyclo-ligase [Candidatus Fermentithermobacillaceae bacterium]